MAIFRHLLLLSVCPFLIHAHMEMSWPYPINSQLNPDVPIDLRDYSYTSPLLADGSNFPCKGYQLQSTSYNSTATYSAGGTYNMTIAGTVMHGGGSCQLSLSYDNGATFNVIKSMIGGCPITTTYDFTIPSFAPSSGSALLAWSWFNLIGDREMYMDCARVQIQGSSSQRRRDPTRRAPTRRQSGMSGLPNLFVCNVNNGCTTIEGENVQFPDPGTDVVTGNDTWTVQPGDGYTGTPVAPGSNSTSNSTTTATSSSLFGPFLNTSTTAPFSNFTTPPFANSTSSGIVFAPTTPPSVSILTVTVTATPSATSPSLSTFSSPSISTAPPSLPALTALPSFVTTNILSSSAITLTARTTMTQVTLASSGAVPSATVLSGPCTPGTFGCNSPTSFSQCVGDADGSTSYTYMGSMAAGMQCLNGQIIRQNDGPCTPNGQLFCNGEFMFYLCDQSGLINMGPVAPGTACVNGMIGYPPSRE